MGVGFLASVGTAWVDVVPSMRGFTKKIGAAFKALNPPIISPILKYKKQFTRFLKAGLMASKALGPRFAPVVKIIETILDKIGLIGTTWGKTLANMGKEVYKNLGGVKGITAKMDKDLASTAKNVIKQSAAYNRLSGAAAKAARHVKRIVITAAAVYSVYKITRAFISLNKVILKTLALSFKPMLTGLNMALGPLRAMGRALKSRATQVIALGASYLGIRKIISGIKDDLANVGKKGVKVPPAVVELKKALDDIQPRLASVQDFMEQKFLKKIPGQLQGFVREFQPQMYRLAGGVAIGFNVAIRNAMGEFSKGLREAVGDGSFNKAVFHLAQILGSVGRSVGQIGVIIMRAFAAALPFVNAFAQTLMRVLPPVFNAIQSFFKQLAPTFQTIGKTLSGALENVAPSASGAFKKILDGLASTINSLAPLVAPIIKAFMQIGQAVRPVIVQIAKAFTPLVKAIAPAVVKVIQLIADAFTKLAPVIGSIVEAVAQYVQPIIEAIMPMLQQLTPIITDLIKNVLLQVAPILKAMAPAIQQILQALMPLIPPLAQLLSMVVSVLAPVLSVIVQGIALVVRGIAWLVNAVVKLASSWQPLNTVMQAAGPVLQMIGQWVQSAAAAFQQYLAPAINIVVNLFRTGWNAVITTAGQVLNRLKSIVSAVANFLSNAFQGAINAASAAWHGFVDIIQSVINALNTVMSVAGKVAGAIGSVVGKVAGVVTGHAGGGLIGRAGGGLITGPGSGTSDSILGVTRQGGIPVVRVSNGEYVVNAESTRKYLPLLEAINKGNINNLSIGQGATGGQDNGKQAGGDKCACIGDAASSVKDSIQNTGQSLVASTQKAADNTSKSITAGSDVITNKAPDNISDALVKNGDKLATKTAKAQVKVNKTPNMKSANKAGQGGGQQYDAGSAVSDLMGEGESLAYKALSETFGFDGSVIKDPMEWNNVKSLMGFANAAMQEGNKALGKLIQDAFAGKIGGPSDMGDQVVQGAYTPSGAKLNSAPTNNNPILNQQGTGAGPSLGGGGGNLGDMLKNMQSTDTSQNGGTTVDNRITVNNNNQMTNRAWRQQAQRAQASRTRNTGTMTSKIQR